MITKEEQSIRRHALTSVEQSTALPSPQDKMTFSHSSSPRSPWRSRGAFTKHDLAIAYFPQLDAVSAHHKLCNLIHEDMTLLRRLRCSGYKKTAKKLTPCQLKMIFERLGRPW